MRQIVFIIILFLSVFNLCAQDSVVMQKLKINEIAIVGTAPIIQLYNYSSNREISFAALKDDNVLNNLISSGYTDTSKATKMLRPIDFYGGNSTGGNIGVKVLFNLPNNFKNKWKTFIPFSILYETRNYTNYYIGRQDVKRIDTLNISGSEVYLDSVSEKASKFRFDSEGIFIQSGLNIESGKKYFHFSAGLNIGLGVSFRNNLYIKHVEYSAIQPTNQDSKYYESTYSYSEDKIQKVKPIFTTRFLVPFCLKVNLKKIKHIGFMAEISPGFEMNKIVKGDLLTRWLLFCSLGARYTF